MMTFARGIQRNINIVILFPLKLLPCRWIYYRLPLCLVVNAMCSFKKVLNVYLIEEMQ